MFIILKDREDDIPAKQQSVAAINRSGRVLSQQESLSTQDKDNINKDLENLNARWSKVRDIVDCCLIVRQYKKNLTKKKTIMYQFYFL